MIILIFKGYKLYLLVDDLHPVTGRVARHVHDMQHSGVNPDNCPRHVCECDKNFLNNILEYQKKCNNGETEYCLNDTYQHRKLQVMTPFLGCTELSPGFRPRFTQI